MERFSEAIGNELQTLVDLSVNCTLVARLDEFEKMLVNHREHPMGLSVD